ncbi:MAG: gliding motility-associated C-terminal domain-containing protein [Bacteroidetes bacterium]|nr:gliding motility-associated C-terminal domain-containing protein [Bacteroidota bacterium]
MKKYFIFFILLCLYSISSFATHERSAEITFRRISNSSLQYEIKVVTYTYTPSPADRPDLQINWGDGTSSMVARTLKTNLPGDVSRNEYVSTHTYPGDGTYKISMEDPNRNSGVINIPNSVNIPIFVETMLVISPFINPKNNSPVLLNPPLDMGCVGSLFVHNPGAYDPDGDSISYKLVSCRGVQGLPIPGYTLPLASNFISINPVTGDLIWDSPTMQGEYNVAILIEEWRNGVRIGYITRDMQIIIAACNNHPPVIDPLPDTCVEAGDTLVFNVHAKDPDGNSVTLSGYGGPLSISYSPAIFNTASAPVEVNSLFYWETKCQHIRKQAYQVTFKAQDNGSPVALTAYRNRFITVVGPAPKNLKTTVTGNTIKLNWNKSDCSNAIGYKVYRKNSYYGYFHAYCETGVPAYTGYSEIASVLGINDTTYLDDNNGNGLLHGIDYCYMVYAYYPDGAESYASLEACAQLKRDVPIITNITITSTSSTIGTDTVAWSKPTELDTIQVPGPYKYLIYRSADLIVSNFVLIDSLSGINDTIYADSSLNTLVSPYNYRIDFYNDQPLHRFKVGSTHLASSVYLSLTPADRKMKLSWNINVPWINYKYTIYRKNPVSGIFDSIGNSTVPYYTDKNLKNGIQYCYYVKSIGSYSISNIINPIINLSQQLCAAPIDNEAPCPPKLIVTPDCQQPSNTLDWINTDSCDYDIKKYYIWYTPNTHQDLSIIAVYEDPTARKYIHFNISSVSGCYAVSAVDSNNNTGLISNVYCIDIDSCSFYHLPNMFSPNGDGINDLFRPYPYQGVEKIDLKIYNRWGTKVFSTSNPDINWDGKDQYSQKDCSEGVYYYVCDVYELRLKGEVTRQIHGSITILR